MAINKREPKFKEGDLVKLNKSFVEKVMNHKQVFKLYHPHGAPRNWIVSLCNQNPMRVNGVEEDHDRNIVLALSNDPRGAVWQQEWFELVAHNNFDEVDDLFEL